MTDREPLTDAQAERLARYRAGALEPGDREAFEREALESDALAEALYGEESFDALDREAAVAHARRAGAGRVAAKHRARARWIRWAAIPAAAAATIVVALVMRSSAPGPDDETLRSGGSAVALVAPRGDLAAPPERFEWTADPAAESYRLELFDAEGALVAIHVTSATSVGRDALAPGPVASGAWRVVPLDRDGMERPAPEPAAFVIRAP